MAPAPVQSNENHSTTGNVSSLSRALSGVVAGNFLVVSASTFNTTLTIADDRSQSWTRDLSVIAGADAGFAFGHFANTVSGTVTITVTRASGTNDIAMCVGEYSGVDSAGTPDGTAATTVGTAVSSLASATLTTAIANSLVFVACGNDGGTGTPTVSNSYVKQQTAPTTWSSANMDAGLAHLIKTVAGATSSTWAANASAWAVGIVAFKAAAAATTPLQYVYAPRYQN